MCVLCAVKNKSPQFVVNVQIITALEKFFIDHTVVGTRVFLKHNKCHTPPNPLLRSNASLDTSPCFRDTITAWVNTCAVCRVKSLVISAPVCKGQVSWFLFHHLMLRPAEEHASNSSCI